MRVLLAQNMPYRPGHGGATKSNRLLLEELAARGHSCVAVTRGEPGVRTIGGVEVFAEAGPRLPRLVREVAGAHEPDWVLVPSDDPGLMVLGSALRAAPERVVYLVHTLQQLPFGPRTFYPSGSGRRLVARCRGLVSVSRAARDYVREHGDLDSTVLYPHVYGSPPFPDLADMSGPVTMVNPCGFKGLPILLGLADARPDLRFRAVPTWGGLAPELATRPNIEIVPAVEDITQVLRGSRALLMPSLWDETFGYTAVEAMLHGVPVLAADVGGLREAMLGVPHLLPVNPIVAYEPQRPGEPYPRPAVPPQDLGPWLEALDRVDAALSARARAAATAFVAGIDPGALEKYLVNL
ncbi:glycosyltransferase family 4 protein [Dactylosporangium matsuzakiense]|uniref:Glycosyl transferase family 1 n=1 Tax=Dactylosporangium matsuzakiense TaxID=53360 RepID=A0A9W6NN38_9ACTN|nr:glycosyltransferase family 4 protein [Dactylosporangium matsuzakiense]UWZ45926.1 glycosyltransferase family 4 protein [Dactylosporangium matsuzakiense]GLL02906.1 glycosyl transferase family 1 [Dactylosporangium matsuzakiense]